MIGLKNFIFYNYKRPLIKERGENKNEVYVEGLETRYIDMCLFHDLDNLTDKVHDKIMENLLIKLQMMLWIGFFHGLRKIKRKRKKKFRFSIEFKMCGRYDVGNYFLRRYEEKYEYYQKQISSYLL